MKIAVSLINMRKNRQPPSPARISGGSLACAAFCLLFGGSFAEAAASFSAALLAGGISAVLVPFCPAGIGIFVQSFAGGALSRLFCLSAESLGILCRVSYVTAGSFMAVVPGLKLCSALRSGLSGNFAACGKKALSGLCELLLVAAGYALASLIPAPPPSYAEWEWSFAARLFFCAVGTVGFCMLLNVRTAHIAPCTLSALAAYSVYSLASPSGMFISCFLAAAAAVLSAAALSRAFGAPQEDFLMPALVPLAPGAQLFYAAEGLLRGNVSRAVAYGADAFVFFAAITAGLAAAAAAECLFRAFSRQPARSRAMAVKLGRRTQKCVCSAHRQGSDCPKRQI